MLSLEERINNNVNNGIAESVFVNENTTYSRICEELSKHGEYGYNGVKTIYDSENDVDCLHSGVSTIYRYESWQKAIKTKDNNKYVLKVLTNQIDC